MRISLKNWLSNHWDENFVLLLPIINALATILTSYYSGSSLNPGTIRGAIIVVFSIWFFWRQFIRHGWITHWAYSNIVYFFFICLFSSNVGVSMNSFLKYYVSFVHLFFGIYYGRRDGFIRRMSISVLCMLSIYLLDFVFANIFNYGGSSYSGVENVLNFGGLGVNLAKSVAVLLMLFPFFFAIFQSKPVRNILFLLVGLSLLFILFAFKRSAMLGTIVGFLILIILYPSKGRLMKFGFGLLLISLVSAPLYIPQVMDNYRAREEAIDLSTSENLEKQARYLEYFRVTDAWINGSWSHKMFGSEMFNDRSFFKVKRMLHTDYMTILNGGGVIGIVIFVGSYLALIIYFIKAYLSGLGRVSKVYSSIVIAMTMAMLIFGVAGIIHGVEPRAIYFLITGCFVSYHTRRLYENKVQFSK